MLTITDDGPGFPPDLVSRLGEPYLTTRGRDPAETNGGGGTNGAGGGLGLGIFIAKTLLERTGAKLTFDNATSDGRARVRITWPRERIETAAQ